jgi:Condensation domain
LLVQGDLTLEGLENFYDHKFDLKKGPLFKVRIIQIEDLKYKISFKIHHVIFDGLSSDVLIKDLVEIYEAFSEGRNPLMTKLAYQYKEYMAMVNNYSLIHRDSHRQYWAASYQNLPPELLIPGAVRKNIDVAKRLLRRELFIFPDALTERLNLLAKRFDTGLFVILQATFNAFIYYLTSQNDILIGTYVHGRDYPGCEDQIGCYARVILIRTVIGEGDSLHEIIDKVKRSNEDAKKYTAFPLKAALGEMLPSTFIAGSHYGNIFLQLADLPTRGPVTSRIRNTGSEGGLIVKRMPSRMNNSLSLCDLQLQFYSARNYLELELQYDGSLYNSTIIKEFASSYIEYSTKTAESNES